MQKRKEKTVKAESAEVISENITEQESNQEQAMGGRYGEAVY